MRKIRYDGFVTVLCLVILLLIQLEVCVMSSPYSRFYVLRALEYSQFFQKAALSKHLKILLKCMLHFSVYVLPYLFIKTCILLILTLLAMDFFKPNVYLSETLSDQNQIDLFLRYLATSLQILLVNNWGEIMSRCIYHHGAYVSLYFVIPAVLLRFFLENIMLSLFLHTYSEIYWEYIKVQDNRMGINFEKRGLHKANAIVSTDMRPSPSPRRPSPNILTMDAIRKLVLQSRGSSPTRKSQQWYGQKSPHSTGKLSPVIKAPNDIKKKSVIPSPILLDPLEGEFIDPLKSDYCEFIQDIDTLGLPIIRTRTKLDSSRSFFDKPENSETDSVNNAQDMEILEQLKNIGDGKSPKTPQSGPRGSNLLMPNKRYVSSGFKEMSDQKIKALENLNQEKTSFLQVGSPGTNLIKSSLKPKPKGSQEGTPKHGTPKSQNSGENSRRSSKHGSKRSFHMGKDDVPGLQSPRSGVEDTRRLGNKLLNLKTQMNLGPGFSSHVNRVDTETTRNLLTEENREDPFSSADKTHIEGLFSPRDVQEPPENLTKVRPAISIGKAENLALRGFRKKSSVMPVVHSKQ